MPRSPLLTDRRAHPASAQVDENFFEVFSFPLDAGDPRTALRAKDGVVVSRDFARRYFGDEPAVGQVIRIDVGWPQHERKEYTIQAVVAPPPANSSIQLNILLPFHNSERLWRWIDDFWDRNCILFVLLKDANEGDLKQTEALIRQLYIENSSDYSKKLAPLNPDFSMVLQPLSTLHTGTDVIQWDGYDGIAPPRDPLATYIVLAIAVLLLAVAVVNYVNLATARASTRGLEVGVRVALGATRRQLPVQFWIETVVVCSVSLANRLGSRRGAAARVQCDVGSRPASRLPCPLLHRGRAGPVGTHQSVGRRLSQPNPCADQSQRGRA